MISIISKQPLTNIFWQSNHTSLLRDILLVIAASLLIAVSAQISVPFYPIPMTLQTFTVLFISMALGWKRGLAAVLLYILEGAAGLPIFANFAALATVFARGSAGYIVGFIIAAAVTGYLTERDFGKYWLCTALTAMVGTSIIFICGVSYLATIYDWQTAINLGFIPFILGDSLKVLVLAVVIPTFWKKTKN